MKNILIDLERNQERLKYFKNQLEKNPSSSLVSKWIDIYTERTKKLEKQAGKIGLTTDLNQVQADATKLAN